MKILNIAVISIATAFAGLSLSSCTSTKHSKAEDGVQSANLELYTIYFDFDKYHIRADQTDHATKMAESIVSNGVKKVQIQGNTDDRGSVEYNMALGTRRAESLKRYLIEQGVDADVIDTVSYGKERPAVQSSDETGWAQNRRDDVVLLEE